MCSMGTQHVERVLRRGAAGQCPNGQVDLGKYSLDNMAAVTLTTGRRVPGAVGERLRFGECRLPANPYPGVRAGRRHNLKLTLKGGSFGTVNPSVLYEQRLGEQISNSRTRNSSIRRAVTSFLTSRRTVMIPLPCGVTAMCGPCVSRTDFSAGSRMGAGGRKSISTTPNGLPGGFRARGTR